MDATLTSATRFLTQFCILLPWILQLHVTSAQGQGIVAPPFFIICNYHGQSDQSDFDSGEVSLSVSIQGDPEHYVPGQLYPVTISSSQDFDGFLVKALYTVSSNFSAQYQHPTLTLLGDSQPFAQNFRCSARVHSYFGDLPKQELNFIWVAPQKGTGCVSFHATATLEQQILFKDISVLQICEEGSLGASPPRPLLTALHQDGVIFRDDFDSSSGSFDSQLWSHVDGLEVGRNCGAAYHGNAATACRTTGSRRLVTVPLNLTTASLLQFGLSVGKCNPSVQQEEIKLLYGTGESCTNWTTLDAIPAPRTPSPTFHVVHIPHAARQDGVCLRWEEMMEGDEDSLFGGCWAMDNVIITNTADPPTALYDDFDPVDLDDWIFFPGARIVPQCHADQSAMVFAADDQQTTNFGTTRDLNLESGNDRSELLLEESFETAEQQGWFISGAVTGTDCGSIHEGLALEFTDQSLKRIVCTRRMDLSSMGSLKFFFSFGDSRCSNGQSDNSNVFVYVEDAQGHSSSIFVLPPAKYTIPREVSIAIPQTSRNPDSRICWNQKTFNGSGHDVWSLDSVRIHPVMPSEPSHFVQFNLNLDCENDDSDNTSVELQYSADHGHTWQPLYENCRSGSCIQTVAANSATFSGSLHRGWVRLTLPLPHAALSRYTRLRWALDSPSPASWALDNVFIGRCEKGCHGHGACTPEGCRCDLGFTGALCERAEGSLPTQLVEDLTSLEGTSGSLAMVRGAPGLGYTCGVVSTGKALVFSGDGPRRLETVELNTTTVRYLQFSVRMGSDSVAGNCPPPDDVTEGVYIHYTCDGGISWRQLEELPPGKYTEPVVLWVPVPEEARGEVCRFRWWQPQHSGQGQDMWALDDLAVSDHLYNAVSLNFNDLEETGRRAVVHQGEAGPYCGRPHTLSFTGHYTPGEQRYLATTALAIGPSYMMQFSLAMGCTRHISTDDDNEVYLEYSTNHGMTWDLVRQGCWPPRMCEAYREPSVYHAAEFQNWRRVTMELPPATWSSATRFRFRQSRWGPSDSWALSDLYIGLQCPELCGGHGQCHQAECSCDEGFGGPGCSPVEPISPELSTDFTLLSQLDADWSMVLGGEVVGTNQGCGTILSGESIYFSELGPRKLVSRDVNTTTADFLQFYARLGGNDLQCYGVDTRAESVLVQYSADGGVTWRLLDELQGPDYTKARLVHLPLPAEARTPATRFRWWQPTHSGPGDGQWALDQVLVAKYEEMAQLEDHFEVKDDPSAGGHGVWLTLTEGMQASYCGSQGTSLMFANQASEKMAVTKDVRLKEGYVIQFKINVGCTKTYSADWPVLFEASQDAGMTWQLVEPPCYMADQCHDHYTPGSVYHAGSHGDWTLVTMPVPERLLHKKTNFRWWQKGDPRATFALDDVYIGPPCPAMCSGHGVCHQGACKCEDGFEAPECTAKGTRPSGMIERFEDTSEPGPLWGSVVGGQLAVGCGEIAAGNSLYFSGDGPRGATTVALNTTDIRLLQFSIRIGNKAGAEGCRAPKDRNEGVIVDYSIDSGVTWNILDVLDAELFSDEPHIVTEQLPSQAKTSATLIRWWQPTVTDRPRAEWALDDVIIAVNETSRQGFQENFNPLQPEVWYMAMNAVPKITCSSRDNALEFSKNGQMRYAETWDYQVNPSTFLQFDIAMGCSGTYSTLYSVMLEYSTDMGRHWRPVMEECLPPSGRCSGYHLSSSMVSEAHTNWTRITLYLPPGAVSPATRLRWLQKTVTVRGNVWALDNVYLGDGCPWMCSGHGYCNHGVCVCDPGFGGEVCVPTVALPMDLKSDFDHGLIQSDWPDVYGAEVTDSCGRIVSGKSLTFFKENLRMAITRDLDVSMATFMQFQFQFGCNHDDASWQREHTVLLQYSTNGGILWNLFQDLHSYSGIHHPRHFHLPLPLTARTNATRFRFWQPRHEGLMQSVWGIDDVFVGGSIVLLDSLVAMLDSEPNPEMWLFWPGGEIDTFCSANTRSDSMLGSPSSLVFRRKPGEHSVTSQDLSVNDMTVVQFEINVGCSGQVSREHPVSLEYSTDHGLSWQLLVTPCGAEGSRELCGRDGLPATIYYPGETAYWRRVVVPLQALQICGTARFRWYQDYYPDEASTVGVPEWALRNVYIGFQCVDHCMGHGFCLYGMLCQCQDNYGSDTCVPVKQNPKFFKEDFDGGSLQPLSGAKWWLVSGADRTTKCGTLLSGWSLHFFGQGSRQVVTTDLDLTTARLLQFYLRLGCSVVTPDPRELPVHLQFSKDGGITWTTIHTWHFGKGSNKPMYVVVDIPHVARSDASRLRWWQPSEDGLFLEEWAIDQVFLGGDTMGAMVVEGDLTDKDNDAWLMWPGAKIQTTCGLTTPALHFTGDDRVRYAITNDVSVTEATYLQFYLSMGCSYSGKCFEIDLEFSRDLGKTWQLVEMACLPSLVNCTSYHRDSTFTSDVYHGWHRVTIHLPHHVRSKTTRFRWMQHAPFSSGDTWAVTSVYIGDECQCSCAGHGRCSKGRCICDKGWGGDDCSEPLQSLPTMLTDDFSETPSRSKWSTVNGGAISSVCGILSAGPALHFQGGCRRQLVTTDLDLRAAMFIHFNFIFGCLKSPRGRDEGLLLDYSTDGGGTWTSVIELHYDQYPKGSYIMVDLPKAAKTNGARIRWWQPSHDGPGRGDWAVDGVVIGGKEANPNDMKDWFNDGFQPLAWLQRDNVRYGAYCRAEHAVMAVPKEREMVTLVTADVTVQPDHVLQFSISVGCNASWDAEVSPVRLEFSTDYGMTWALVTDQCLPFLPECHGQATPPSVYFSNPGWRRVTIPLEGAAVSKATRFRWQQALQSDMAMGRQHWALDDVYVGPRCESHCHGHGRCDFPRCVCDPGYGGATCQEAKGKQMYLRDTFSGPELDGGRWDLVQGGHVGEGCQELVEGHSLHFSGRGQRLVTTADLDLRNARFVQYYAGLGGASSRAECGVAKSRNESLLLQYSTDAGITWHVLHVLDFQNYHSAPQRDYIPLPREARTLSTRVRWWQPLQMTSDGISPPPRGWSLDDIYIGGSEINPSEMYETFNDDPMSTSVESLPGGQMHAGICGRSDPAVTWGSKSSVMPPSVTSQQMIVQRGYMLQFKIEVGCGLTAHELCTQTRQVELQYNRDPTTDVWEVVLPRCHLNSHEVNMECRPYDFTPGSVYPAGPRPQWRRVTLRLPPKVFSTQTRFRWRQVDGGGGGVGVGGPTGGTPTPLPWALDDIYIGESCPDLCSGHGDCVSGRCRCEPGYDGESCRPLRKALPTRLMDGFEGGVSSRHWARVEGGGAGQGCGPLLPLSHGNNLYFGGCSQREAVTQELDSRKASKIMFVLQIGSVQQNPLCRVNLGLGSGHGMVILQYTLNGGVDWGLIATHDAGEFLRPRRVGYELPLEARARGIQFRWWQPQHGGQGHDHWAIDHVELILIRSESVYSSSHNNLHKSPSATRRRWF